MTAHRRSAVFVFAVVCAAPAGAHAQWFAGAYLGAGWNPKKDVAASIPDLRVTATHMDVAFDPAVVYGARVGYWLPQCPSVGFALDAFGLNGPDEREQLSPTTECMEGVGCRDAVYQLRKISYRSTGLGLAVMLRYPLGELQPYVSAGVAAVRVRATDTTNFIPAGQSSTDTRTAPTVGAGVAWHVGSGTSLLLEYRYLRATPRFSWDNSVGTTVGDVPFTIHAVAGGVTFTFR